MIRFPASGISGNIRQLTFGGNNAEAYFSSDGQWLTFQRQQAIDRRLRPAVHRCGSTAPMPRQISNGLGRTTCGYFIENDQRIIFSFHLPRGPGLPGRRRSVAGLRLAARPLRALHGEARRQRPASSSPPTGLQRRGDGVADGKRVIFTSHADGDVELYTMNATGPTSAA
jgi:TolB protein